MTQEERDKLLNIMSNYKRLLANIASNIAAYDNWSDEFCRKKINDLYDKLIKEFQGVDFTKFTGEELKQLDFRWFDENLICCPAWVIDCLEPGTKMTSISNEEMIWEKPEDKNAMKDTRFGVTAYGFNRSQLRDSRLETILGEEV